MKKAKLSFSKRKQLHGYIFISPWLVASIFLLFFPLIFSLSLSFANLESVRTYAMSFVGFKNYVRMFTEDTVFIEMFLNIVKETLTSTPIIIVFSLIIAIVLSKSIKFNGFFRSMFFLPVLIGTGFVMAQVLGANVDQEAVSAAQTVLLPDKVRLYLGEKSSGMILNFLSSITVYMWKSGVQIVIALAGIQKISPALYESARVDSATEWEMFWKITIPMMSPIILLNTVYTIIASFTEESPMVNYIIDIAFGESDFEYAAAIGWIYFVFILLVVGIVFACMRRSVKNASET